MYKHIIYALCFTFLVFVLLLLIRSLRQNKKTANYIFTLTALMTLAWVVSLWIADTTTLESLAVFLVNIAVFCVTMLTSFFLLFTLNYPEQSEKKRPLLLVFLALYNLIFLFLALSNQIIISVELTQYGATIKESSVFYLLHIIQTYSFMIVGLAVLNKKKQHVNDIEKARIRFITWGVGIAFIANVLSGTVATYIGGLGWLIYLATASLVLFVAIIGYTILRHQLFDVSSFIARSTGYVFTVLSVSLLYALIVFGFGEVIFGFEGAAFLQNIFYVGTALFIAFSFPKIKSFFDRLTNKIFYQDSYEPQALLNDLNNSLVSTIDINMILKTTSLLLQNYLRPSYAVFYIPKTTNSEEKRFCTTDMSDEKQKEIITVCKELPEKSYHVTLLEDLSSTMQEKIKQLEIGLVTPLISSNKKQVTGIIILGTKKSGTLYNKDDSRILKIIADELVIAIQNALRFEEIQNFNITLQEKIDKATHQLRQANERLKQLDQTKDDFISMASHQLRTPLTSVKGYVSMVLEGDTGKVSAAQKKLLDQAFVSSQRMVYLIADLLNVSRLRTGKFVIEPKPTNLADVVEGEIAQLTETAKGRGLELTYAKPKAFPTLMLDETKIRQVIMNFADNAIYYTPSGGHIKVVLEEKPDTIEFRVEDDGIGVPKSEQHHLFNKFYRAGNAKKARPDGTGLGLFMAKKVVVAQGGSILFTSTEGKGSVFGFSFAKAKLDPGHFKVPKDAKPAEEPKKA